MEKEEKRELLPKSGWQNLIKVMNDLGIPMLKSYEYLPNYEIGFGGYHYMIEVATAKRYRFYDYFNPQDEVKDYPEAAALEKFLTILEREFSFKRDEIFE